MKPLPNLRQLRYLTALAEHLHFGHAAAACGVTQSKLSAGIRELEATLGVPLAERTKRSVLITPVGHRVVERARVVLREAEALVEIGSAAAKPLSGRLDLGVIPTIGPFLLPRLMPRIGARYPALKLILREDKTTALLDRLADGRLDLLLMAFPYATDGCDTMMLFDDGYRFACDPQHPLANAAAIGADDLQRHPLMLLEKDNCLHSHALPLFEAAPRWHETSFAATSLHTLVAMVGEGLGATLLPEMALSAGILEGSNVVTRPLADDADARTIGLAWRKQSPRAAEFRALGALIRDWAQEQLGKEQLGKENRA
jgi:LysR family transcriptional regulator, hydrogen peroxide-inducible genes activator